ncbi:aldo/keto reductase [Defluviimonas sp. WL0002]|uniref:Aldo/keto reductase n=1 Tax=Albidovulum marisflavi TaxID=2984159 RepID=A0ABT2ZC89_9RHOB|nr:aldo/keto reductase [Defluviimonas sp. WL0002]MCV2868719.1 aldo/keto reductase [Defluviimonas sp. WL0002]
MNTQVDGTPTTAAGLPFVGFGTYLIANDAAPDAVAAAIEVGYRHIDTAAGYHNEKGVGEGIRRGLSACGLARADLFVTTKLWPGNSAWGEAPKGYEETISAFEVSLAALGLDYVDLYLIHAPSGGSERVNEWRALVELKAQGKARAIGVSNYTEEHIEEIRKAGLPLPEYNQIELHPWSQKPDLLEFMAQNGIAPIAYSSLVPLSTWRAEPGQNSAKTSEMRAAGADADSPFKAMAAKYGVTEAQVLLRWGVQKGFGVLPKSMNPARMRQNIDLFSFALDAADMALIENMDRGDGVAWATGDPRFMG